MRESLHAGKHNISVMSTPLWAHVRLSHEIANEYPLPVPIISPSSHHSQSHEFVCFMRLHLQLVYIGLASIKHVPKKIRNPIEMYGEGAGNIEIFLGMCRKFPAHLLDFTSK